MCGRRQIWNYTGGSEAALTDDVDLKSMDKILDLELAEMFEFWNLVTRRKKEKVWDSDQRILLQSYKLYQRIFTICFSIVMLV